MADQAQDVLRRLEVFGKRYPSPAVEDAAALIRAQQAEIERGYDRQFALESQLADQRDEIERLRQFVDMLRSRGVAAYVPHGDCLPCPGNCERCTIDAALADYDRRAGRGE